MQAKHILLTTDLSEEALRAFEPVRHLAEAMDARVTLLHVIQVVTAVPPASMLATPITLGHPEEEVKTAEVAIEEQRELLGSETEVNTIVLTGEDVARTIVHYAKQNEAGLIAVSTHGRSGLRRVLLGSVAENILRHSEVPVLCFPPPAEVTS